MSFTIKRPATPPPSPVSSPETAAPTQGPAQSPARPKAAPAALPPASTSTTSVTAPEVSLQPRAPTRPQRQTTPRVAAALVGRDRDVRRLVDEGLHEACTPSQKARLLEKLTPGIFSKRDQRAALAILASCDGAELSAVLTDLKDLKAFFGELGRDARAEAAQIALARIHDGPMVVPVVITAAEACVEPRTDPGAKAALREGLSQLLTEARQEGRFDELSMSLSRSWSASVVVEAILTDPKTGELGLIPQTERILGVEHATMPDGSPGPMVIGNTLCLTQAFERAVFNQNDGEPVLTAWKSFDPSKQPVVSVHGHGSAEVLAPMLSYSSPERTGGDYQDYILFYNIEPHVDQTGNGFARALDQARTDYWGGEPVDLKIKAFSYGGYMSFCALHSMSDPRWMGEDTAPNALAAPVIGNFGSVQFYPMDATTMGFGEAPFNLRKLPGKKAKTYWADMVGNALVHERLVASGLDDERIDVFPIDIVESAPDPMMPKDKAFTIPSLNELTSEQIDTVLAELAQNRVERDFDDDAVLQNLFDVLQHHPDYASFSEALRAITTDARLSPEGRRNRFRRAARDFVPNIDGTHIGSTRDPAFLELVHETVYGS